jgi:putative SOS response-associated peptidase YedK
MLTVNADDHRLMNRFHRPRSEKRSVVILPPTEYESWLGCRNTDEAFSFLQLYPAAAMHAEPWPLPPRKPRDAAGDGPSDGSPDAQASLLSDG